MRRLVGMYLRIVNRYQVWPSASNPHSRSLHDIEAERPSRDLCLEIASKNARNRILAKQMRASTTHYTGSNNDPHSSNMVQYPSKSGPFTQSSRFVAQLRSGRTEEERTSHQFQAREAMSNAFAKMQSTIALASPFFHLCLFLSFTFCPSLHAVAKPLFEVPEFSGALRR